MLSSTLVEHAINSLPLQATIIASDMSLGDGQVCTVPGVIIRTVGRNQHLVVLWAMGMDGSYLSAAPARSSTFKEYWNRKHYKINQTL